MGDLAKATKNQLSKLSVDLILASGLFPKKNRNWTNKTMSQVWREVFKSSREKCGSQEHSARCGGDFDEVADHIPRASLAGEVESQAADHEFLQKVVICQPWQMLPRNSGAV